MENWTEVKTAFLLGQMGTVSATADAIGVHRATVIRRVESLEAQLGGKLFQRHAKGYTPTELGLELIRVAEKSDDSFRSLLVRAKSQDDDLRGDFVVSCPEILDYHMFFGVKTFKSMHPDISVHFKPSDEVLKLEYGDADVALTLGRAPDHPDYIVRHLMDMPIGLFCSILKSAHELGDGEDDQSPCHCRFVRSEKAVYGDVIETWIEENIPVDQIVLTSATTSGANDAVLSGLGAGFLPCFYGRRIDSLIEVMPPAPDWVVPIWVVTHVDLHRSAKVQSFLSLIKNLPNLQRERRSLPMNTIQKESPCATCSAFCSRYTR
ncbi:MAG: LysR family transcriptional regulator [Pseudomonadota bacterium]